MDKILLGVFKSDTKPELRKALLCKIVEAAKKPHNSSVIENVLQVSLDFTILPEHASHWEDALWVYLEWAKNNLSTFKTLWFKADTVTNTMTAGASVRSVFVIQESLRLLYRNAEHDELSDIYQTVSSYASQYLISNQDLPSTLALCNLFLEFKGCIPNSNDCVSLCDNIISMISQQHFQARGTSVDIVNQMKLFEKNVETMASVLNVVWSHENAQPSSFERNMVKVFEIISSVPMEEDARQFPISLGSIVKYIKLEYVAPFAENIAGNKHMTDQQLMSALLCMQSWFNWPSVQAIDVWLKALLGSLADHSKVHVCLEFAEENIETLFKRLTLPHVAEMAYNLVAFLLTKYTHSPFLFHKVCVLTADMLVTLKNQLSRHTIYSILLPHLAKLCYSQIALHPGYPEIYDNILDVLKEYDRPPSPPPLRRKTQAHGWVISHDVLYSPRKANSSFVLPKEGNLGLENLGNTCYMNSCIQALFFVDRFRCQILSYDVTSLEPSARELQQVFLFLKYSQRPYYCPSSFSKKCRPSYFALGAQQDAAEYLRYFLDHLHEDFMNTVKSGLTTVKGQEMEHDQVTVSNTVLRKFNNLKKTLELERSPNDPTLAGNDVTSTLETNVGESKLDSLELRNFERLSILQNVFGGSLESCIKCLSCGNVSRQTEQFVDITLAFPDGNVKNSQPATKGGCSRQQYKLIDMLKAYFVTEKLQGSNQYSCDECTKLQDAEKSTTIKTYPETLVLTLMRFKYDAKLHIMSKISGEVKFPLVLPLSCDNNDLTTHNGVLPKIYVLTAVLIHSGISSHSGHYYVYARHLVPKKGILDNSQELSDFDDLLEDKWFLANDETVTEKKSSDFLNITQKYHRDTPYMLFYSLFDVAKARQNETEFGPSKDPECPKEILSSVHRDNEKYRKEKENSERKIKAGLFSRRKGPDDSFKDDDNEPPGSCGGHFNNSFDSPRFIF